MGKLSTLPTNSAPVLGDSFVMIQASGPTDVQVTEQNVLNSLSPAWTTWTPTLTNLAGGTITYSKYLALGKTIFFRFRYALAGAGVSGIPGFTLPTNLHADYVSTTDVISSTGQLNDADSQRWLAFALWGSSSRLDIWYLNSAANYTPISASTPFLWASGDEIMITGNYQSA